MIKFCGFYSFTSIITRFSLLPCTFLQPQQRMRLKTLLIRVLAAYNTVWPVRVWDLRGDFEEKVVCGL